MAFHDAHGAMISKKMVNKLEILERIKSKLRLCLNEECRCNAAVFEGLVFGVFAAAEPHGLPRWSERS
jgi:hypothetical protein